MSLFSDWDEYERMGNPKQKKAHLANLERERRERELEAEARRRCIYPRCSGEAESGKINPAMPWINSGLCREHYRSVYGDELPPETKKRHAAAENARAINNELNEWEARSNNEI